MGGSEGNLTPDHDEWRKRVDSSEDAITEIVSSMRRLAVIGIKTEAAGGAAFRVPQYLQRDGYDIVPVPVYFPEVTEILGVPVHRSLSTVIPPADMVVLFRRPSDVPGHLAEMLAAKPRVVWMQQGIEHAEVAEQLARAGIRVVQDRCLLVEISNRDLPRLGGSRR